MFLIKLIQNFAVFLRSINKSYINTIIWGINIYFNFIKFVIAAWIWIFDRFTQMCFSLSKFCRDIIDYRSTTLILIIQKFYNIFRVLILYIIFIQIIRGSKLFFHSFLSSIARLTSLLLISDLIIIEITIMAYFNIISDFTF